MVTISFKINQPLFPESQDIIRASIADTFQKYTSFDPDSIRIHEHRPDKPLQEDIELRQRRGRIQVSKKNLLETMNFVMMKALFSNFFPVGVEPVHSGQFYEKLCFWGYSPYFDIIGDMDEAPLYDAMFKSAEGVIEFEGMTKLSPTVK